MYIKIEEGYFMEKEMITIEEREIKTKSGAAVLILNILFMIGSIAAIINLGINLSDPDGKNKELYVCFIIIAFIYACIVGPILFAGLKIINPNEGLVLTLFGNYYGTIKKEGFYWVNPFVTGFNPAAASASTLGSILQLTSGTTVSSNTNTAHTNKLGNNKKISLKTMTLNNGKQKVNDALGNPIEIGVVIIWRITNTVKAVFNVDNFMEYLSIQSDSAIRNISRLYAYDIAEGEEELSLRGSSKEVADKLKAEIQSKVEIAGIEVIEARITHLAYATEIAAIMLQRQQAAAIIDARKMIVDGAVGMVEMALGRLDENGTVKLDDERKAAMVSNLLVVLCASKEAQPIVNSGSIY